MGHTAHPSASAWERVSADGARAGRGGLAAGPRLEQPRHRPARSLLQDDELKYTLKRLVEGLGATREAARPGFSLALAQVSVSQRGSEPSAAHVHAWGPFCCLCKAGGLPSGRSCVHVGGRALTITVVVLNGATLLQKLF